MSNKGQQQDRSQGYSAYRGGYQGYQNQIVQDDRTKQPEKKRSRSKSQERRREHNYRLHLSKIVEEHRGHMYDPTQSPNMAETNLKSSELARITQESYKREEEKRPQMMRRYGLKARHDSPAKKEEKDPEGK